MRRFIENVTLLIWFMVDGKKRHRLIGNARFEELQASYDHARSSSGLRRVYWVLTLWGLATNECDSLAGCDFKGDIAARFLRILHLIVSDYEVCTILEKPPHEKYHNFQRLYLERLEHYLVYEKGLGTIRELGILASELTIEQLRQRLASIDIEFIILSDKVEILNHPKFKDERHRLRQAGHI